jgi:hypothetical protein
MQNLYFSWHLIRPGEHFTGFVPGMSPQYFMILDETNLKSWTVTALRSELSGMPGLWNSSGRILIPAPQSF